MARIRYLKPDFFKDEDLAELPCELRLFFEGLWCYADKAGRLEDRPLRLKAEIMPYEKNFDADEALNILARPKPHSPKKKAFIVRYQVDGEKYVQILSWEKHQKPHHTEAESVIPPILPSYKKGNGEDKGDGECSRPECSDHEPISNRPVTVKQPTIRLILDEEPKRWEGITDELKALWVKTYPGCDIDQVLQEMIAYWDAQPKSKRKLNWKMTIVNRLKWLQDHGGTKREMPRRALPGSQPPGTWLRMMKEKEAKEKAAKEGKS